MLISILIVRENVAFAEPVSQVIEGKSWNERSWEERVYKSKYEDRYTFKHGKPYTLDPWTGATLKSFQIVSVCLRSGLNPSLRALLPLLGE